MTQMSDENTICCPYCNEWQHLDDIDKQELIDEFKFIILECEDCGEKYKAGIDVEINYNWVIEKLSQEEIRDEISEEIDVPGQLFFSFYGS